MYFIFTPILGEMIQSDEHIFQRGWNHELVFVSHFVRNPNPTWSLSWVLDKRITCKLQVVHSTQDVTVTSMVLSFRGSCGRCCRVKNWWIDRLANDLKNRGFHHRIFFFRSWILQKVVDEQSWESKVFEYSICIGSNMMSCFNWQYIYLVLAIFHEGKREGVHIHFICTWVVLSIFSWKKITAIPGLNVFPI